MLYSEIIAVCSEIHTKHINTLCGLNVELLNVKHGGTYSNDWALEVKYSHDDLAVVNHFRRFFYADKTVVLTSCQCQKCPVMYA
jgi:hypothetical protein